MKNSILILLIALGLTIGLMTLKKDFQDQVQDNKQKAFADTTQLQTGDLLFQDLDCGPLCDAIEKVTTGVCGAKLSHVGLIERAANGRVFLIEAYGPVARTPIVTVLNRHIDRMGFPLVIIGRLREKYDSLISIAMQQATALIGKPYDDAFILNNDSYYCSELVYESFKKANADSSFFEVAPMTFKDPQTGLFLETWVNYYKALHQPIPEGEPGINPGLISRSDKLHIVHLFGFKGNLPY